MERVEYEPIVIQDLINLHKHEELNLNPWYQRRSVWLKPQKAYLINTIFEQKPIPSVYIRHSLDIENEKSIREVVDGQQRIRAILEYVDNEFAARHPNYASSVAYRDLRKADAERFRFTSLSVGYLLGATDEDVIEIFGRLNSVAKTLNPQEKRNAQFSGEFKQFCLKEAAVRLALWRELNIFTANDIARMHEVEFISDLALNFLRGLSDYRAGDLDKLYGEYDETFPGRADLTRRFESVFHQIASLDPSAIGDTIFRRQPLFFSLCIVLNSGRKRVKLARLQDALFAMDKSFNSDLPLQARAHEDADFASACTASTQRIRSRKIRDAYIRRKLGL